MMQEFKVWDIQRWDGGDRADHDLYITSEEEKDKYLAEELTEMCDDALTHLE